MMNWKQALLIGVVCVVSFGCDDKEGRVGKYIEQANASLVAEDFDKARIEFKNALKIEPKNVEALMGMARTFEKLQEWRKAVSHYRAVLEITPDNIDAKVKLGQLYLLANEGELAESLADEVLANDSVNQSAILLKAGGLAKQGQQAEALKLAEKGYKIDPSEIDGIILYSTMLLVNQRVADAQTLLQQESKNHPESVSIHSLLAKVYINQKQFILAEQELVKLAELEPKSIQLKNNLAQFYEEHNQPEKAEQVYREMMDKEDDNTAPTIALFRLYMSREDVAGAEKILQDQIAKDSSNAELQFALANFYLQRDQQDEAEAIYTKLLKGSESVAVRAKNRIAYLREMQNQTDEAMKLAGEILEDYPGNLEALVLRGQIYLKRQDPINAVADLRSVLSSNPDNPAVLRKLAVAHVMNKEPELAIEMLRSVIVLAPKDLASRASLAELYRQTNQHALALQQYEIIEKTTGENTAVKEKLVEAHMANRDMASAKEAALKMVDMDDQNAKGFHYLGLISQAEQQHQEAISYFDQALAIQPSAAEPMGGKVRSLIALEKLDEALSWLDKTSKQLEDNPVPYNFKGEILLAKLDYSAASKAFSESIKHGSKWWIPHRNKALASLALGQREDAKALLKEGITQTDGAVRLRLELAGLHEQDNENDAAMEQYESVLAQDPKQLIAANNLVMLLVSHRTEDPTSLDRALQIAQTTLATSENALLQDTVGWVHYVRGDYERALPLIKRALQASPDNAEINYHLGMTYYQMADQEKALEHLGKALGSNEKFRGYDEAKQTQLKLQQALSQR